MGTSSWASWARRTSEPIGVASEAAGPVLLEPAQILGGLIILLILLLLLCLRLRGLGVVGAKIAAYVVTSG